MQKSLLILFLSSLLLIYKSNAQETKSLINKTEESKEKESNENEEDKKEADSDDKVFKNEVSLNAFLMFYSTIELNYERIFNQKSAVGITVGYGYVHETSNNSRSPYYWAVHPYYRFYFGKKKTASGFFLEAHAGILKESYVDREEVDESSSSWSGWKYTRFFMNEELVYGGGAVIGYKWIIFKRFTSEIFFGMGKNFIFETGKNFNNTTTYPKLGIKIGGRF